MSRRGYEIGFYARKFKKAFGKVEYLKRMPDAKLRQLALATAHDLAGLAERMKTSYAVDNGPEYFALVEAIKDQLGFDPHWMREDEVFERVYEVFKSVREIIELSATVPQESEGTVESTGGQARTPAKSSNSSGKVAENGRI